MRIHLTTAFLLLAACAQAAPSGSIGPSATVNGISGIPSVIDGDTLEIHGQRIRLFGMDAPESRQNCRDAGGKLWRCGARAANALSDMINRRPVSCEQRDIDRYGRIVGACRIGSVDLSGWMVRQGWAVAYRRYSKAYIGDEDAARRARRGIWSGTFDMPGDWRKGRRAVHSALPRS